MNDVLSLASSLSSFLVYQHYWYNHCYYHYHHHNYYYHHYFITIMTIVIIVITIAINITIDLNHLVDHCKITHIHVFTVVLAGSCYIVLLHAQFFPMHSQIHVKTVVFGFLWSVDPYCWCLPCGFDWHITMESYFLVRMKSPEGLLTHQPLAGICVVSVIDVMSHICWVTCVMWHCGQYWFSNGLVLWQYARRCGCCPGTNLSPVRVSAST